MEALRSRVCSLKSSVENQATELEAVHNELSRVKEECSVLSIRESELLKVIDGLKGLAGQGKGSSDNEGASPRNAGLSDLHHLNVVVEQAEPRLREILNALAVKCNELTHQLKDVNGQLEQTQGALNQQASENQFLRKQFEAVKGQLEDRQGVILQQAGNLDAVQKDLQKLQSEKRAADTTIASYREENGTLKQKLEEGMRKDKDQVEELKMLKDRCSYWQRLMLELQGACGIEKGDVKDLVAHVKGRNEELEVVRKEREKLLNMVQIEKLRADKASVKLSEAQHQQNATVFLKGTLEAALKQADQQHEEARAKYEAQIRGLQAEAKIIGLEKEKLASAVEAEQKKYAEVQSKLNVVEEEHKQMLAAKEVLEAAMKMAEQQHEQLKAEYVAQIKGLQEDVKAERATSTQLAAAVALEKSKAGDVMVKLDEMQKQQDSSAAARKLLEASLKESEELLEEMKEKYEVKVKSLQDEVEAERGEKVRWKAAVEAEQRKVVDMRKKLNGTYQFQNKAARGTKAALEVSLHKMEQDFKDARVAHENQLKALREEMHKETLRACDLAEKLNRSQQHVCNVAVATKALDASLRESKKQREEDRLTFESRYNNLEEQMNTEKKEKERLMAAMEYEEKRVIELLAELNSLQQKLKDKVVANKKLEAALKKAEKEVENLRAKHEKQVRALQAEVEAERSERERVAEESTRGFEVAKSGDGIQPGREQGSKSSAVACTTSEGHTEQGNCEHVSLMESLNAEIEGAKKAANEESQRVLALSSELDASREEVSRQKDEIMALEQHIKSQRQKERALEAGLASSQEAFRAVQKNLEEEVAMRVNLEDEVAKLQDSLTAEGSRALELERKLSDVGVQLALKEATLKEALESITALQGQCSERDNRLASLSRQLQAGSSTKDELESERKVCCDLKKELGLRRLEVDDLTAQLAAAGCPKKYKHYFREQGALCRELKSRLDAEKAVSEELRDQVEAGENLRLLMTRQAECEKQRYQDLQDQLATLEHLCSRLQQQLEGERRASLCARGEVGAASLKQPELQGIRSSLDPAFRALGLTLSPGGPAHEQGQVHLDQQDQLQSAPEQELRQMGGKRARGPRLEDEGEVEELTPAKKVTKIAGISLSPSALAPVQGEVVAGSSGEEGREVFPSAVDIRAMTRREIRELIAGRSWTEEERQKLKFDPRMKKVELAENLLSVLSARQPKQPT